MKKVISRSVLDPIKVYYNFDFENTKFNFLADGVQFVFEGYSISRIEEIMDISVKFIENSEYRLEIDFRCPYDPTWDPSEVLSDVFLSNVILVVSSDKYSYSQNGKLLIPQNIVYRFNKVNRGVNLEPSKVFSLIHDPSYFHIYYCIDIV